MTSPVVRVLYAALLSRLLVLLLAVLADLHVTDYDTSGRYDVPNTSTRCQLSDGDEKTPQKDPLLRSFCRVVQDKLAWDSVHYVRIAQCGYETEKSHAFFPLFPALMRGVQGTVLRSALPVLYPRCTLALSGLLLSNVCFVLAALALFWLSCLTVRDGDLALRAALLFCFNPASIFFSSVYTESLFAFLSWAGALSLAVDSPWRAAVAFSAAAATRSNGVVTCILLLWDCARRIARRPRRLGTGAVAMEALGCILRCAIVCMPTALFQAWAFLRFCVHVGDNTRPWCHRRPLPLIYTFVQEHYWDLGLFRFFQWKQLPNFALAAPMIVLTVTSVRAYIRADPARWMCLGLLQSGGAPWRSRRLAGPYDAARMLKPAELAQLEREEPGRAERQKRQVEAGELVPFGFTTAGGEEGNGGTARVLPAARIPSATERTVAPSSWLRHRNVGGSSGGRDEDDSAITEPVDVGPQFSDNEDDDDVMQELGPDMHVVPAVVVGQPLAGAAAGVECSSAGVVPEFGFLSTQVLPHVLTVALLALPAVLVMHVHVITRLLCTYPATYWYAAHVTGTRPLTGRLIWAWFLVYAALGTVLHVNFYPWT